MILQWYYTYITFVKTPASRSDILLLSLESLLAPIVRITGTVFQGICQILADALMVNLTWIVVVINSTDKICRSGAVGTFYLSGDISDWR